MDGERRRGSPHKLGCVSRQGPAASSSDKHRGLDCDPEQRGEAVPSSASLRPTGDGLTNLTANGHHPVGEPFLTSGVKVARGLPRGPGGLWGGAMRS